MNNERLEPQVERNENVPSSVEEIPLTEEEVKERIEEDTASLLHGGENRLADIAHEVGPDDPAVRQAKEKLRVIGGKASAIRAWAFAALALLGTKEVAAQHAPDVPPQPLEQSAPESQQASGAVELRYDNPQREAYRDYDAHREYLRDAEETYRQNRETHLSPEGAATLSGLRVAEEELSDPHLIITDEESRRYVERLLRNKERIARSVSEEQHERDESRFEAWERVEPEQFQTISDQFQQGFRNMDEQQRWLADVTHSKEYEERVREREELSKEELEERRQRSRDDAGRIEDALFRTLHDQPHMHIAGQYHGQEEVYPYLHETYVVKSDAALEGTIPLHEHVHYMTRGNEGLSEQAKSLYQEALNTSVLTTPIAANYFSNFTEIDARKKQFEYELEQLTDWRYGTPFTQEHVRQAYELMNEDKLSQPAEEFLHLMKKDYLERVMNTIANTDRPQEAAPTADTPSQDHIT